MDQRKRRARNRFGRFARWLFGLPSGWETEPLTYEELRFYADFVNEAQQYPDTPNPEAMDLPPTERVVWALEYCLDLQRQQYEARQWYSKRISDIEAGTCS